MPVFNYLNLSDRLKLIKYIKSEENKSRKAESLREFEIYQDRQHQYVVDYLKQQFSSKTVKEMPVVSSINLARRIVNQESSLYREKPTRTFSVADKQLEQLEKHYSDLNFDAKMLKANSYYKLQNQNLLMIIPKNGKLYMRVLLGHHYDVVPSQEDPEVAEAYIISSFDKDFYLDKGSEGSDISNPGRGSVVNGKTQRDGTNQPIAEGDDFKGSLEKYILWTKDYNFIFDGNGKIVSGEDVSSPLADMQVMPFVDIAMDKDFEYFVRQGQSVTDFSIQYCGALSDLGNVVKMQGWAQAWLKGSKELMPENIQIGPNFILKLPIDPNDKVETEFGYSNPNPDLDGSIKYVQMLLSNFLTSRGLDPKIVNGMAQADTFSSGIERLLAMIEKFEASKADIELFKNVEQKCFELIKAWNNTLVGTDVLAESPVKIDENATMNISFYKPEMIQTRKEKLDMIQQEMELGLISRLQAVMQFNDVDEETAIKMIEQIDKESISLLTPPKVVNGQGQGA